MYYSALGGANFSSEDYHFAKDILYRDSEVACSTYQSQ